MPLTIYADGASKGNPGKGSGAAVIVDGNGNTGRVVDTYAKSYANITNNEAEWTGLLLALRAATEHQIQNPIIRIDSNLVVQQFRGPENGGFKCKDPRMAAFRERAMVLAKDLGTIDIDWISRDYNKIADQASNDILAGTIKETLGEPDRPIPAKRAPAVEPQTKPTPVLATQPSNAEIPKGIDALSTNALLTMQGTLKNSITELRTSLEKAQNNLTAVNETLERRQRPITIHCSTPHDVAFADNSIFYLGNTDTDLLSEGRGLPALVSALDSGQNIADSIADRHEKILKELNTITITAIRNGTVTLVSDELAANSHAPVITRIVSDKLREKGRTVLTPDLNKDQELRYTRS